MAALTPTNSLVTPMLTDMYQISMTYAYWKNNKHNDHAVFDLFFRKNPFEGEYCIFAGQDEVIRFLTSFRFKPDDIDYLKSFMTSCEPAFFDWLLTVDCSKMRIYSMDEGSMVFPKLPLLRVEGPLAVGQLLETTLLNLVNFPSLIATNAARMRRAAGFDKELLEFGLRRAQGPDGAMSASKYSYLGGFDGTSNVLAGKLNGIDVKGTNAHAYVMGYTGLADLNSRTIGSAIDGSTVDFADLVLDKRAKLGYIRANEGELASFISYAQAFPNGLLAIADTYDTLGSGVPNFLSVAWALFELGYRPIGIRLDSGDLAELSKQTKRMYKQVADITGIAAFANLKVVASNDINEAVLLSMNEKGHGVDVFGIGTNLVTCQAQPALGGVYKLVEINGKARIKLSNELEKLVIPCRKSVYRLYGSDGKPISDIIQRADEPAPRAGERVLCRNPFKESDRVYVTPTVVRPILNLIWDGDAGGAVVTIKPLKEARAYSMKEVDSFDESHTRSTEAKPYRVSVSISLYDFLHELWMSQSPIAELS